MADSQKAPFAWTDQHIEKLIEHVRGAPFIYDCAREDHHDLSKTTNFWNSLATKLSQERLPGTFMII